MKPHIRTPYFETGIKCYIYGQAEIDYAAACEAAAIKHDIDVIFISSYVNISTLSAAFPHLYIFAPYMDAIRPGRGMGMVLPESLREAGAAGVVLNHSEKPMTLSDVSACVKRCRELDMLSFVCANSREEAAALARLKPDIMNPEPAELIGGGRSADMRYAADVLSAIKGEDTDILVEIAAGITTPDDVYGFISAGCDGTGAASGILKSPDPASLLDEMVAAVRRAKDDSRKDGRV